MNDDVDSSDHRVLRHFRQSGQNHCITGNIQQISSIIVKEVMVVRYVSIEVGAARLDRDFSQQADLGELIERVVDRCQRNLNVTFRRFTM